MGKSDAQLDAEAAGRKRKPIAVRLEGHRRAYYFDCIVPKLSARQPPTTFNYDTLAWETEDGAVLGVPMSGPMLRRISESPGARYPWATAFGWLRHQCRRNHPDHRAAERPYWRGRLCWEAVRLTVIGGEKGIPFTGPLSVEQAAQVLRLDRIEHLLHTAFDDIEAEAVRIELRAESRLKQERGLGPGAVPRYSVEQRHDQPGMHAADCPRCRRAA